MQVTRHYISHYRDMPMPALRDDAYYGHKMQEARKELEAHCYAFDTKTGREYEQSAEVSRFSNQSDYDPSAYASHLDIWEWIFAPAIKSRAARLANLEHM